MTIDLKQLVSSAQSPITGSHTSWAHKAHNNRTYATQTLHVDRVEHNPQLVVRVNLKINQSDRSVLTRTNLNDTSLKKRLI